MEWPVAGKRSPEIFSLAWFFALLNPLAGRLAPESGAEATAFQTLARLPGVLKRREAFGVRRVHRRFSPARV